MKLFSKIMITLLVLSLLQTSHAKRGFFEKTWDILPFTNNSLTEYTTPVPTGDIIEFDKKETSQIIQMSPQKAVEYVEGRKKQIAPAVYINDLLLEGENQAQEAEAPKNEPKIIVQKSEDNTKEVLAFVKEFLPKQTVQQTSPQVQKANFNSIANEITLGIIGVLAAIFVGGIFSLLLTFGVIAYFYLKFKESQNKLKLLENK